MKDKQLLRQRMLVWRMAVSEEIRTRQNNRISEHLLSDKTYINCKVLFIYVSVNDEISTKMIISHALKHGKTVCVPKCKGNNVMEAYQIKSYDDLTELYFGIPEPDELCNKILPPDIDLCVIPALCCDKRGYRLGYGGGYYDRYLPKTNAVRIALCAGARMVERLPIEKHDIKCHKIVTEDGVFTAYEE